jgi:hypothetical protein
MDIEAQKRAGQDAAEALLRLRHDPDFKAFLAYLQVRLDIMRKMGDTLVGQDREWNQGKCQALQYIIDLQNTLTRR